MRAWLWAAVWLVGVAGCGGTGPARLPAGLPLATLRPEPVVTVAVFMPAAGAPLKYLLGLPAAYGLDPARRWPVLLYLHGSGGVYGEVESLQRMGLPLVAPELPDFGFVLVAPHCSGCSDWAAENETLLGLLDEITATYAVDPGRVYLTGFSLGGRGAYQLAAAAPARFAAAAILGGGEAPALACALQPVPLWIFNGEADSLTSAAAARRMTQAVQACGGTAQLTVYPEAGHDIERQTYLNPELYAWFERYQGAP